MSNTAEKELEKNCGTRVYRGSVGCKCLTCTTISSEGLVIHDDMHARYLFDWTGEGVKYFTTKEEVGKS